MPGSRRPKGRWAGPRGNVPAAPPQPGGNRSKAGIRNPARWLSSTVVGRTSGRHLPRVSTRGLRRRPWRIDSWSGHYSIRDAPRFIRVILVYPSKASCQDQCSRGTPHGSTRRVQSRRCLGSAIHWHRIRIRNVLLGLTWPIPRSGRTGRFMLVASGRRGDGSRRHARRRPGGPPGSR
jgi:hypothetical protein